MLVVIEKAFADASAAAKTVRDSFMVDIIICRRREQWRNYVVSYENLCDGLDLFH